jgi:hypothetical protein
MSIKDPENFHRRLVTLFRTLRDIQQLELLATGESVVNEAVDDSTKQQQQKPTKRQLTAGGATNDQDSSRATDVQGASDKRRNQVS